MALGARGGDVLRLVVRQGLKLALCGVSLGLTVSLALTRLMEALLFGVSATDPLTFVGIALLLFVVAIAACWMPARRATKDRKSTRLNSSHLGISYAVFCLK